MGGTVLDDGVGQGEAHCRKAGQVFFRGGIQVEFDARSITGSGGMVGFHQAFADRGGFFL